MAFRPGHLRYFVAVAEQGQITRAARELHIAQPALSQAIAQLEDAVGVKLLDRHARGVSLTPAGKDFYVKARLAVAASLDAERTAHSLARAQRETVEFGFFGAPPALDSPEDLDEFARAYPSIELRYRELPFPTAPFSAWLAEVDLAVGHLPERVPGVWIEVLRREPRVALLPASHRLASARMLRVEQILDQTFIGFHPSVDPLWAGFWSLDDHRGQPPAKLTADRARNPQEAIAALATGQAITTVPQIVGTLLARFGAGALSVIPLQDAVDCTIAFAGLEKRRSPAVDAVLEIALRRRRQLRSERDRGGERSRATVQKRRGAVRAVVGARELEKG